MVVFIPGNFNTLHIGHLRLFQFCTQKRLEIIIGLYGDNEVGVDESFTFRKSNLSSVGLIKKIIKLTRKNYLKTLNNIKPDFLLKGSDRSLTEAEEKYLSDSSCEVIFNSANQIIAKKPNRNDIKKLQLNFLNRHRINVKKIIDKISITRKSVAVFGDLIIDEYIKCNTNGISQEDDHTIYSIQDSKKILGGAFLSVSLLSEISKKVIYFNPVEDNLYMDINKLDFNSNIHLLKSKQKNHIIKKRFTDGKGQVVFRLTDYNHSNNKFYDEQILESFVNKINEIDYVIFSDFNYGSLSDNLVLKIKNICKKRNIPIFADSQYSSQFGDLKKYNNVTLVTPTEYEARCCLQSNDGLALLAEKLAKELSCRYLVITLGEFGIFIIDNVSKRSIDIFPALNISPKYISGAGDTLLSYLSFGLVNDLTIWEAAYLASVAVSLKLNTHNTKIIKSVQKYLKRQL